MYGYRNRRNLANNIWPEWESNMAFFSWLDRPSGPWPPHSQGFENTFRHTHITLGRTPLDEWWDRCSDLYLTIYNTHKRQISMPTAGFEPAKPSRRAAAKPRLGPHDHRDRSTMDIRMFNLRSQITKTGRYVWTSTWYTTTLDWQHTE